MDIRIMKGDITDVTEGLILHGCNDTGAMGSGVALAISNKWPLVRQSYLKMFEMADAKNQKIRLGQTQYVKVSTGLIVANGITQSGFGSDGGKYATVEAIEECINTVASMLVNTKQPAEYRRVHMPQIGGARGGLNFEVEVMPVIEKMAAKFPSVTFIVWEYDNRNPLYT